MSLLSSDWAPLQPILDDIIQQHSNGISEYEVFEILKSPPYELFNADALRDPLMLFQSHFILFNALYQLRDKWLQEKTGILQINYKCIRQLLWQTEQQSLAAEDKLRSYYLNWSHFTNTDQEQAESLLDSFWIAFKNLSSSNDVHLISESKALRLLGLNMPFSPKELKIQYRKMLHQHHPDKGGNHIRTIELHNAYQQLKRHNET